MSFWEAQEVTKAMMKVIERKTLIHRELNPLPFLLNFGNEYDLNLNQEPPFNDSGKR